MASPADLSTFVDGELGAWRRRRIARHVRRCEPCRRYVEQLEEIARLTAGMPDVHVSPELRARLETARVEWAAEHRL